MRWEEKFLYSCATINGVTIVALQSQKVRDALEIRPLRPSKSFFAGQLAGLLFGVYIVRRLAHK